MADQIASPYHSDSAEQFGPEQFGPQLTADGLTADGLVAGSQ
jgi:hypothetical protein